MTSPYIANNDQDRQAMLGEIGVTSVEELFIDIPPSQRQANFRLPPALSEAELVRELNELAASNAHQGRYSCFLGAGSYRHFIPGVVTNLIGRSEFLTPYTPYQAEVSQGTLQAIYEYQSLVCQLTGMGVSNAGMYDGATALAEAALMACRITGRKVVAILSGVNPAYQEVVRTYSQGLGITPAIVEAKALSLGPDHACLLVQNPDFFGCLERLEDYAQLAHAAGALLVVVVDPISLGLLKPPGEAGADIVVAEGQPLGIPPSFGGPSLGIFACREEYLRHMPGRIVGQTVDMDGETGYVLTLQTREQHIRRERATSNICTNSAWLALAATIYLAALGKQGLKELSQLCYHKAHYAAARISRLKGYSLVFDRPFFKEFAIRCPVAPSYINRRLLERGIIGGLDLSPTVENGMLLCVTELHTRGDIDRLVGELEAIGSEVPA
ncbi:MAG TPA: aminomethyl-transferring glycine dehydrogenase subunit GcvPA [Dehalococcoidia bacterium]|nr:aminomethyl-transferring glycine dehydrogenase subunit GcvPA [Dehalococcoidia bacterium]